MNNVGRSCFLLDNCGLPELQLDNILLLTNHDLERYDEIRNHLDKIAKKQQPTQLAINDYDGGTHHAESAVQLYGDTGEFWWDYDESSWTDGWSWQYDDGTVLYQFDSEDDYAYYWDDDCEDENYYDDESWGDNDGSWTDLVSADAESQYYQQEEAATEELTAEEASHLGETLKGKGKGYGKPFRPWISGGKGKGKGFRRPFDKGKGKGKSKGFRRSFGEGKGKGFGGKVVQLKGKGHSKSKGKFNSSLDGCSHC